MRRTIRLAIAAGAALGLSVWVAPLTAGAQQVPLGGHLSRGADHVVFVQTDNTAGNQIVAFHRADDGTLSPAGTYDTGGQGGVLNGSAVDHLASQGSLTYDEQHDLLYAVNAGSNTVSVFSVTGDRLSLRQVTSSRGTFPVSVAVHGDLVYVLNALDGASVSGFRVAGGRLHRIEGSTRSLALDIPSDTTQFTHTPGQVVFSPDGSQVLVTTKANGDGIDVFAVRPNGRLSATPIVNSEAGTVPFAVTFDAGGHLLVANAGTNALATYRLHTNGTVTVIDAVGTGQAATCWVAPARGFFYTSNAGSASVSGYRDADGGQLTLLGATSTGPGTVDASASADGRFLYVQAGGDGTVDEFHVNTTGSLTPIGTVTVAGAVGGEGIVAS